MKHTIVFNYDYFTCTLMNVDVRGKYCERVARSSGHYAQPDLVRCKTLEVSRMSAGPRNGKNVMDGHTGNYSTLSYLCLSFTT